MIGMPAVNICILHLFSNKRNFCNIGYCVSLFSSLIV